MTPEDLKQQCLDILSRWHDVGVVTDKLWEEIISMTNEHLKVITKQEYMRLTRQYNAACKLDTIKNGIELLTSFIAEHKFHNISVKIILTSYDSVDFEVSHSVSETGEHLTMGNLKPLLLEGLLKLLNSYFDECSRMLDKIGFPNEESPNEIEIIKLK